MTSTRISFSEKLDEMAARTPGSRSAARRTPLLVHVVPPADAARSSVEGVPVSTYCGIQFVVGGQGAVGDTVCLSCRREAGNRARRGDPGGGGGGVPGNRSHPSNPSWSPA